MDLEEIEAAIEGGETLDLSGMDLNNTAVEHIISTIVDNQEIFAGLSSIDLSGNHITRLPNNFDDLLIYMNNYDMGELHLHDNTFDQMSMEMLIQVLAYANQPGNVTVYLFNDDVITPEQCMQCLSNSMLAQLKFVDPGKQQSKAQMEAVLMEYAKNLLLNFGRVVNDNPNFEPIEKLRNLRAKDQYDFNRGLLHQQILDVIEKYYNPKLGLRV